MKSGTLFRMGLGAVRACVLGQRIPLNVVLSVTNRCNSNCSYCNIPNRKQRELTTREIFDLIDQATKMGTQRLGLWGGEPLLRDDIGQIIDYAKNKGLFVTLDSNGSLIKEKLQPLKNLDHLILSLDGPEEVHDQNRSKGSFRKTMEAIQLLKGKMPIWTITVLTKYNLESIDFILETAKKHGFLTTFQVLHHNVILGKNLESFFPPNDSYRKIIKDIILKKKQGAPIASSFSYLNHLLKWTDYRKPMLSYPVNNLKCWAGWLYCNVDTDGSVYPCSLLVEKMKSLNYLDVGFKKAFESIPEIACKVCDASCFTEYNYLFSLNPGTIAAWLKAMHITRKNLDAKK
ncbi:radical SAM/SPASM domain-containing protein [Candidatus Omnitrophota bacterium]